MQGHLITSDGTEHEVTTAAVEALLGSSTPFWLDISGTDTDSIALLRDTFHFHPLAVEDAEHFGQRPKVDAYDDYTVLVVYGAVHGGGLVEVHCFCTERYLVTIHSDRCPILEGLVENFRQRGSRGLQTDQVMLLYRVLDALIDGYFPVLADFDDRIDELEDEILGQPNEQQLGQLFDLKRTLIAMRKVVSPQRDMVAKLVTGMEHLPGMTSDAERYFRDLYDHLIRITDLVDSYRDLLSSVLDTHLSTVSNRLNVVMKQLTIIATIFLPMSFLTGFFGQNFTWMVGRLTSATVFWGVGVGLQIVVALGLLVLFRRRGWLTSDAAVPSPAPASRPRLLREDRWKILHLPPPAPRQAPR